MAGKLLWQSVSYLWIVGSAWHDFLWMGKGLDRGQSDYTFGDKTEQVSSIFRTKQQVDILVTKKRQFGNSYLGRIWFEVDKQESKWPQREGETVWYIILMEETNGTLVSLSGQTSQRLRGGVSGSAPPIWSLPFPPNPQEWLLRFFSSSTTEGSQVESDTANHNFPKCIVLNACYFLVLSLGTAGSTQV